MNTQEAVREERPESITVEIYDQTYHLRGQDLQYIERLAAAVDAKMRTVASQGTTVDSLRVAVLAALNIADQLATLQREYRTLASRLVDEESSLRGRAHNLNGLLDSILEEDRRVS